MNIRMINNNESVEITLENNKTVTRKVYIKGRQFVDFVFYYKCVGYIIDKNTLRSSVVKFNESDYYTIK